MTLESPVQLGETPPLEQRSYELVPRGAARVLDVGCGAGEDVFSLAERLGASCLVVGVDVSLERVDEAQSALRNVALNVQFAVADARLLPFPDESFDVVRADGLFSALSERARAMRELTRVLAPGGRALIHDVESVVLGAAEGEPDILGLMRQAGLGGIEVTHVQGLPPNTRAPRTLTLVGTKAVELDGHAPE